MDLPSLSLRTPASLRSVSSSLELPEPIPAGGPAPAASEQRGPLVVERITSLEALLPHVGAWQALCDRALEPNPFYAPWMALPALRHLGERPELLLVWAAGARGERSLCGLFPLSTRPLAQGLPLLSVRGLWRYPSCALCTPLLDPVRAADALEAFLDWAAEGGPGGAPLALDDVPGEGPFHQLLVAALHRRGWRPVLRRSHLRAVLQPMHSAEAYLERALVGRRRKELRRLQARLGERGRVTVTCVARGEDPAAWLAEFVQLESRGWKGRSGVAAASLPARAAFLADVVHGAQAWGALEALALRLDGRPLAMRIALHLGDAAFAYKITYDEAWARFSPGALLEVESLRRMHAPGAPRWADSCAAPERFLVNHLWTERREVQSLWVTTGALSHALLAAALPLARWARQRCVRPGS
jgi:CelD/BcsL family acetyltransferase involved in cellulose biosynthesis